VKASKHLRILRFMVIYALAMCVGSFLTFTNRNIPFTDKDIPVFNLGLSETKIILKKGKTRDLDIDQYGEGMAKWSSSDTSVATVSRYGVVKAVDEGVAKISCKAGRKTFYCSVTVPHIMTESEKYMESIKNKNVYWKLAMHEDIKMLVVGDSISKGSGASEKSKGFINVLAKKIEKEYGSNVTVDNLSLEGTCYSGIVSAKVRNNYDDYDIAIVCFGENDKYKTLSVNYEGLIRTIEKTYTSCSIISVLETSLWSTPSKLRVIENIDSYYNIPYANVAHDYNKSKYTYSDLYKSDGHPTDVGHKFYATTTFNVIKDQVETQQFSQNEAVDTPINSESSQFDHMKYYSKKKMTRVNSKTWLLETSGKGIYGIYWSYTAKPKYTKVSIYIDGKGIVSFDHTATSKKKTRHMRTISRNKLTVKSSIKLVFNTKQAADGFYGIIRSY